MRKIINEKGKTKRIKKERVDRREEMSNCRERV